MVLLQGSRSYILGNKMKFKVGDKVRFELDKAGVNPRIDLGALNEGNGKYSEGIIKSVGGDSDFAIDYTSKGIKKVWKFRYTDSNKPGFPALIPTEEQLKSAEALKNWMKNA